MVPTCRHPRRGLHTVFPVFYNGPFKSGVKIPTHECYNQKYLLEPAIASDSAFVRAWKVSILDKTARPPRYGAMRASPSRQHLAEEHTHSAGLHTPGRQQPQPRRTDQRIQRVLDYQCAYMTGAHVWDDVRPLLISIGSLG